MNKRYLIIETQVGTDAYYTHFIDLKNLRSSLNEMLDHIEYYKGQRITKVYYSNDKLTNW